MEEVRKLKRSRDGGEIKSKSPVKVTSGKAMTRLMAGVRVNRARRRQRAKRRCVVDVGEVGGDVSKEKKREKRE